MLLHSAVKPDPVVQEFSAEMGALSVIAASIREKLHPNPIDINAVMGDIAQVLHQSITGIAIGNQGPPSIDLSKIDFEALAKKFEQKKHNKTELEKLAMFDILLQTAPELSDAERAKVKQSAKELGERINQLLVINWPQKSSARSQLKLLIEDPLDMGLPRPIPRISSSRSARRCSPTSSRPIPSATAASTPPPGAVDH